MKYKIKFKSLKLVLIIIAALYIGFPAYGSSLMRPVEMTPKKCPALEIAVNKGRVFMDVKDAPYECVLRQMLDASGIGYQIWESRGRKITLKLDGVPIETAVKAIGENYAIVYDYQPQTGQYRFAAMVAVEKGTGDPSGIRDKSRSADAQPGQATLASTESEKNRAASGKPIVPNLKAAKTDSRPEYRPGEIIVKFKPDIRMDRINELNEFIGATVQKKIRRQRLFKVRLENDEQVPKALEFYRASGLVISAGRNFLRYPMSPPLPDDPYFENQWNLDIADAQKAWNIETGNSSVIVGVIDTGIDYTHPDLAGNIWVNEAEKNGQPGVDDDNNGYVDDVYGWDFADSDADPMDHDGHGTHVSGIIGAIGNNGLGVAGVCWHVRLMALKVQADYNNDMDVFDIIEAMEYAKEKGVRIFNCSYGGPGEKDVDPDLIAEYAEMKTFRATNGLFVCAAGNDGEDTDSEENAIYPSCYDLDNILSVAASNQDDSLTTLSNYGATTVDLMAPGDDILSTYPSALMTTTAMITIEGSGTQIAAEGIEYAGRTDDAGIQGGLYDCGYGNPVEIPDAVNGNIALIQRGGGLYFSTKVSNAQTKGAIGVVIYNNIEDESGWTLGSAGNWIPAVSITNQDGLSLLDDLPTQITLVNSLADQSDLYHQLSGTSMATPFVTGLAALIVSQNPNIGYHKVISGILDNVDSIQSVSDKLVSGGRVNLFNTLDDLLIPGDLTGDAQVGLDDLVLCLQVLTGSANDELLVFHPEKSDVDLDGKIGLQEAEYIFRTTAGLP